jgi:hypothetical protein
VLFIKASLSIPIQISRALSDVLFCFFDGAGIKMERSVFTHLTGIFASLFVTRADHTICNVQLSILQPGVAQVPIQNGNLHFVHFGFVF